MLGASFKRIQFTPDTSPAELTGGQRERGDSLHAPASCSRTSCSPTRSTAPRRGRRPRCSRRCRSGRSRSRGDHRLPDPFLVIATQNPYEHMGVYALPESQLDRFLKIKLEYADEDSEIEMLDLPHNGLAPTCSARCGRCSASSGSTRRGTSSTRRICRRRSRATSWRSGARRASCPASSSGRAHAGSSPRERVEATPGSTGETVHVEDVREIAPYVLRTASSSKTGTTPGGGGVATSA